jgi:protein phosphatase
VIEVAYGCVTHVGRVRDHNEDSVLAEPGVFVVADGLGGHAAGDVASRIAVEELRGLAGRRDDDPVRPEEVARALDAADDRVRGLTGERGLPLNAGTTVAAVVEVVHEGAAAWLVANVGDSRVYRFAEGKLSQVSVDHSLVQEMVEAGMLDPSAARFHPRRNVVTRALGAGMEPGPDFWLLPPAVGERLLLCSDGLTGEVEDDDIRQVLAAEPDPAAAADRLVEAALEAGGSDNVSVVLVDVLGTPFGPASAGPASAEPVVVDTEAGGAGGEDVG